jgi:hypothetical protein
MFYVQPEVPWPHFANILQRHFLRATRQDPSRPARCLSLHDLEYLHSKLLGGQPMISQKVSLSLSLFFFCMLEAFGYLLTDSSRRSIASGRGSAKVSKSCGISATSARCGRMV